MFLVHKKELSRLRAYRRELAGKYVESLRTHDRDRSRQLFELRRRVVRAILIHEEWAGEPIPAEVLDQMR